MGVVFVWGILMLDDGSYASPDMAFIVGSLSVLFYTVPLVVILANAVGRTRTRYDRVSTSSSHPENPEDDDHFYLHPLVRLASRGPGRVLSFMWRHLGIAALSLLLGHQCAVLWWMYGAVSVVSPWGLGRLVFAVWMYLRAGAIDASD